MPTTPPVLTVLLDSIDGAFGPRGWQGPTLAGSLRGVTPAIASFRPGRGRRCIWEIVLHAAYWKYAVRRHVEEAAVGVRSRTGPHGPGEGFSRSPSNWPVMPDLAGKAAALAWTRDRALLKKEHALLRAAVEQVDPGALFSIPERGRRWTLSQYIVGIAAHDAYHCGQVQLLKRLARGST